jgi:uncharacterized protein YndB with AHSA1/START domain
MSSPQSTPSQTTVAEQYKGVIERTILINAPAEVVFESILEDMQEIPDGKNQPMHLKLEPFPGGRWFRDLGHNTGHLWGHVQVIKPPLLLEVFGPLMISSAAVSHVRWKVTPQGTGHRVTITHKIFGDFDASIPQNVGNGWQMQIDRIKALAEAKK